jgi:hypothetical protein
MAKRGMSRARVVTVTAPFGEVKLAFLVFVQRPEVSSTNQPLHQHTATQPKPFSNGLIADILLSGVTTIDNPAARNWHLDVTSTNPMGVTKQEFINRAALGYQPSPGEHDPRNDVLTSAKQAEERKHAKYDRICAATGSIISPFALETTGGHGASTKSVYLLFTKQMRDSGLPADVLVGKLNKDISFALRRGTIAQVTTQQACPRRLRLATPPSALPRMRSSSLPSDSSSSLHSSSLRSSSRSSSSLRSTTAACSIEPLIGEPPPYVAPPMSDRAFAEPPV